MVKLKRRYFLVECISDNPTHKIEFHHIYREIKGKIKLIYGDSGAGAFMYSAYSSEVTPPPGMFLFKIHSHHSEMFAVALSCVDFVNGQAVQLRCLGKSSTIRSLYRRAVKIQTNRLTCINSLKSSLVANGNFGAHHFFSDSPNH